MTDFSFRDIGVAGGEGNSWLDRRKLRWAGETAREGYRRAGRDSDRNWSRSQTAFNGSKYSAIVGTETVLRDIKRVTGIRDMKRLTAPPVVMQPIHRTLLLVNEEFLVSEAPTAPLLLTLREKEILNDLDLQQLRSLEPQGSRAMKRFVLHVLPYRGELAFQAMLEALQEARAQHLVDLLLEQEAVLKAEFKPIELPAKASQTDVKQEDPNEYAYKLHANKTLIHEAVNPQDVIPSLLQNGLLTPLEEGLLAEVRGQDTLTWSLLWGVLMQRGHKAYHSFMGALLQNGYSALFHTIQETQITGQESLTPAFTHNTAAAALVNQPEPPTRNYGISLSQSAKSWPLHHDNSFSDQGQVHSVHRDFSTDYCRPLATSSPAHQKSLAMHEFNRRSSGSSANYPLTGLHKSSYSLGEMVFQYTPRSQKAMNSSTAPESVCQAVDSLYSPTWANAYNYLRTLDAGTLTMTGKINTHDLRPTSRSYNIPGYRTNHASLDWNRWNNITGMSENTEVSSTIPEFNCLDKKCDPSNWLDHNLMRNSLRDKQTVTERTCDKAQGSKTFRRDSSSRSAEKNSIMPSLDIQFKNGSEADTGQTRLS